MYTVVRKGRSGSDVVGTAATCRLGIDRTSTHSKEREATVL